MRLFADGVKDMVEKHWNEIALDKNTVPLNVNWMQYVQLERMGLWKAWTVRKDDELIGYCTWFINKHIRYQNTTYCTGDVFWVKPEYRSGWTGFKMFKTCFERGLPRPCKVIENEKHSFQDGRVGKLFERLGMKPIETMYSCYLPDDIPK